MTAYPAEVTNKNAGRLGMLLFIASLSMLFGGAMAAYFFVRARATVWPPPGMPRLPAGLWVSTVIIGMSSFTFHRALRSARNARPSALRRSMALTFVLGLAFLVSQAASWLALVGHAMTATANLYGFTFYVLTGLHAAHVIGGLIPMALMTLRAQRGFYGPERNEGLRYGVLYWDFLGVVWLVIFGVLLSAS